MNRCEFLPSGKLRTGWKPGSSRATRSAVGNVSGKSRGAVGSGRPVHRAQGWSGHWHPHLSVLKSSTTRYQSHKSHKKPVSYLGRLAFFEVWWRFAVWTNLRLRNEVLTKGRTRAAKQSVWSSLSESMLYMFALLPGSWPSNPATSSSATTPLLSLMCFRRSVCCRIL